jgi:hypothetical protein
MNPRFKMRHSDSTRPHLVLVCPQPVSQDVASRGCGFRYFVVQRSGDCADECLPLVVYVMVRCTEPPIIVAWPIGFDTVFPLLKCAVVLAMCPVLATEILRHR